ncbi:hypothetical protein ACYOEI_41360, partial [Singulisphaera rosea]
MSLPHTDSINLNELRYEPLAGRPSKVQLTDLGQASQGDTTLEDWIDCLPNQLAVKGLKRLRDAIVRAHDGGRPVV